MMERAMNDATWRKGKKTIKGRWSYHWASDTFLIALSGKDPETGLRRQPFQVHGDSPEFCGWKLVR